MTDLSSQSNFDPLGYHEALKVVNLVYLSIREVPIHLILLLSARY